MISKDLKSLTAPANKRTRNADEYLVRQHNKLAPYESLDHFVFAGEEELGDEDFRPLMHHMLNLRIELAGLLWKNDIFVGRSVLDEFIFQSAKARSSPVLDTVIQDFTRTAAGQPGFVIYPLHGFGFQMPGLFGRNPDLKLHYTFKRFGVSLSAQTHNLESTYKRLNYMADRLGVENKIDFSDLRHHSLAGHLQWLQKNPLMMVRLSSHTGEYYENQFVYTLKIRLAATMVMMLAAFVRDSGYADTSHLHTSAEVNNWQTLDIRHYLVGEARNQISEPIEFRRIPMNLNALELAQLSDVPITLNSSVLTKRAVRKFQSSLEQAMEHVQRQYLRHVNLSSGKGLTQRVYLRISKSLDWYRRSFGSRHSAHERIVALAVAFETLLTDSYAVGTDERIKRRVGICLKGKHGVADAKVAVFNMVHHRNEIMHTGSISQETDIAKSQAVFARCFVDIVGRLDNLPRESGRPISDLLGD